MKLSEAKNLKTGTTLHHVSFKNADGTPLRVRITGMVKTWIRNPEKVKVPFKHGLYTYGYVTEENLAEWSIA